MVTWAMAGDGEADAAGPPHAAPVRPASARVGSTYLATSAPSPPRRPGGRLATHESRKGRHPTSSALTYTTPPRETVAGEQWAWKKER